MSVLDRAKDLLISDSMPGWVVRGLVRTAVAVIGRRMRADERRQARGKPRAQEPSREIFLVDGYHGGVVFWDWLGLPGGGLWKVYNWPLCVRPSIERVIQDERFYIVLDFDAYTYEWMDREDPGAADLLRRGCRAGRVEPVNGTYAQPFGRAESGESFLRQLQYGREAACSVLGVDIEIFYSQEPSYFPQLPQILRGLGYRAAVLRTQWAPFGTEPAKDADMILWEAPDKSTIPTVPRYTFMGYERQLPDHPGLAAGSLSMGDIPDWAPERLAPYEAAARSRGVSRPLVADLKDVNIPDAPLARALEIAMMRNVRFTTVGRYVKDTPAPGESESFVLDDFPCTLPWGLEADAVPRASLAAEAALYAAERLDAAAWVMGGKSRSARLSNPRKELCLAQHHDLYVCGPWHSRAHGGPMSGVAVDYASRARREAEAVSVEAVSDLAGGGGGEIVLFNPVGHERTDYVEVSVPREVLSAISGTPVLSDGVLEHPCQVVEDRGDSVVVGAVVRAPSLGIVWLNLAGASGKAGKKPDPNGKGTPPFRFEVTEDGRIRSVEGEKTEILEGPFLTCVQDGVAYDSRDASVRVHKVLDGPVVSRFKIVGEVAGMPFTQEVTTCNGIGRVQGSVRIDFGTDGVYLGPQRADDEPGRPYSVQDERKLCLAFGTSLKTMCSGSPFWVGECGTDRAAGVFWVGLEREGGGGVAFLNRGTRGYHFDRDGGRLRNVLAWGPREWIYASDDSITRGRSAYTALYGTQRFDYALISYASRTDACRAADEYALPMRAVWCGEGNRRPTKARSLLSVTPDSVIVTAFLVKDGVLFARVWNASDNNIGALIEIPGGGAVSRVGLDFSGKPETAAGGRIEMAPWGICAVRIGVRP